MFFGSNTGLSFRKSGIRVSVGSPCRNFSRSQFDICTSVKDKYGGV